MIPDILQKWLDAGKHENPWMCRKATFHENTVTGELRLLGRMSDGRRMTMYFALEPENPNFLAQSISRWLEAAKLEE